MTQRPIVQSSAIVYKGFFDIQQDILERSDGETLSYSHLVLPTHAVTILAKDPEGRWVLNREYRHPTNETILGCPGGRLEPDEDILLAAQRELHEETGYWAETLHLIGVCYPFPAICNQKIHFYYAPLAERKGSKNLDPFEFIETQLLSHEELLEEIQKGSNIDGLLCTALHYLSMTQKSLKES